MSAFDTLLNVTPEMISTDPFPHIVINNALPLSLYKKLEETFPLDYMTSDDDTSFQTKRYPHSQWFDIDNVWTEFHRYHSSPEFKNKIINFFKKFIDEKKYIRYAAKLDLIESYTTFAVNGLSEIRVQNPHLDHAGNFYVGLFYMRDSEDKSTGGDLELHSTTVDEVIFEQYRKPISQHISLHSTVPYQANTMVWMLTGPRSIHSASSRLGATKFRKYVNINTRVDILAHPYE
jgi:hypothetical protein